MIELTDALEMVLSTVRPLKAIRLPLGKAAGCRLAEPIRSDRDQPPADRSAMDGYAVLARDLRRRPARLRLIGEVAAGSGARPRVRPGACATILTGGNVPPGADTVVPIEQTRREGDEIVFETALPRGANIRRRGEEARRGATLLGAGALLGPAEIGVCAMVGKAQPKVHPRPRVAVLCTGAEVLRADQRVSAHQLRDSNGPALLTALADLGLRDTSHAIVPDNPRTIATRLARAARTRDVVLVTGGVSVGQYDYVPGSIERIGGRIRFHGVRMKPGRPQLYATLPGNRHIFGLPGNPVSVLTGFGELVLPALRRLGGAAREACRPRAMLPLAEPARSKGGRPYLCLARVVATDAGPAVAPIASKGSADLVAACQADGVIVIPADITKPPAGFVVEYHPWRWTL